MKLTKKIESFTLGEMIIVLILTSIVVGLAFSVLTLVQKQMGGIQSNFKHNTEFSKLETSLWIDFNRYSKVKYDALENELVLASEIDSISYRFETDYVVKDLDTFNIKFEQRELYFKGQDIDSGEVDAIKLKTTKDLQNQKLFVFKQNTAEIFMN